MAAAVTQAFESIGNNVTQLGKKFKEVTGYDRLSRDQQAFLTGGASEVYDAVDRSNAGATERVQTQNKAQGEAVMKGLEDADAAAKADEAKKVMAAKRNSTAGSASGRQGTMSGGSLLGGGQASIGSKTLLGQ